MRTASAASRSERRPRGRADEQPDAARSRRARWRRTSTRSTACVAAQASSARSARRSKLVDRRLRTDCGRRRRGPDLEVECGARRRRRVRSRCRRRGAASRSASVPAASLAARRSIRSSSPSRRASSGSPPKDGQQLWKAHQSQSRPGLGLERVGGVGPLDGVQMALDLLLDEPAVLRRGRAGDGDAVGRGRAGAPPTGSTPRMRSRAGRRCRPRAACDFSYRSRGPAPGLVVDDEKEPSGRRSRRSMMPRRLTPPTSASSRSSMPTAWTWVGSSIAKYLPSRRSASATKPATPSSSRPRARNSSSSRSSATAACRGRRWRPRGCARPAGSMKSRSRAAWTRVPLMAGGDGGSGSRSRLANR